MNGKKRNSDELGKLPMPKLLAKMGVPATVGIMVTSIYMIVDTIFIGRYVGAVGIAAISVVLPITFLISSLGLAIGIGGASVMSRSFGSEEEEHAQRTFGNMVSMTLGLSLMFVVVGWYFQQEILGVFGAKSEIFFPALEYFLTLLPGVPFLAFGMMANNVVRSEGEAKIAMIIMLVPAGINLILDPIFIVYFGWGMFGAALATSISYLGSALFAVWYLFSGRSDVRFRLPYLRLKINHIKEIWSIGFITLVRHGTISLLMLVLNNTLVGLGGEIAVATFGIINRVNLFVIAPVIGLTQGFLPIAGYNYGAQQFVRVKDSIDKSMQYGSAIAMIIGLLIIFFRNSVVGLFTNDTELVEITSRALLITFIAVPLVQVQLVGSTYFQAIGKALPGLFLALTKQGFFLIPLILIMPIFFGLDGIWYSFPLADVLSALVAFIYLRIEVKKELEPLIIEEIGSIELVEDIF